jgi:hypothetical protein
VYGIATAGGHRGQTDFNWRAKGLIFSMAATLAAATAGFALGWGGGQIPESVRVTGASIAALGLLGLGLAVLLGRTRRLLERNCETPQSWLEYGPVGWAIVNGAALGVGFTSRIGFVAWYAVPVACIGFGDPLLGAVIFGAYGGGRGFSVWLWLVMLKRSRKADPVRSVLEASGTAKRVGAIQLVTMSAAAIVVVGA